jgi:hypothetical protein
MKPTSQQSNDFFANEPLPGVLFGHNDSVRVLAGEQAGQLGALISIEELGQDPIYLVELASGIDAYIAQSQLEAHEA